ncbi:E3 ubiquitin-protein ligase RNF220-like isoform X3 [Tachypleus tridentatus]|uniref:E3 ubiquitin-protein ligase RNF220-like isoform X3 n=1 Tax=Tachypleus tridentatus TaxID=6853 RepID=UPI003FD36811
MLEVSLAGPTQLFQRLLRGCRLNGRPERRTKNHLCMGGLEPSVYLTSQPVDAAQLNLQVQRQKDPVYHTPFTSTTAFPVRTMFGQTDTYPTLPTHLIPASSSIITPPCLDRQVSFLNTGAGGTFRSLGVSNDRRINGFHASAFIPTKCLKPDNSDVSSSHYSSSSFLTPPDKSSTPSLPAGLPSPVQVKEECSTDTPVISPKTHDRLTETQASDTDDHVDRKTSNGSRPCQKEKKRDLSDNQSSSCPACGVTITSGEMLLHFGQEVQLLTKLNKSFKRSTSEGTSQNRRTPSPGSSRKKEVLSSSESRWHTFQKVKCNRQNRVGVRPSKGKKRTREEPVCPACCARLAGPLDDFNSHVERCIKKRETNGSEDETVDVEGGEHLGHYEWTRHIRIQSSGLETGFAGFNSRKHNSEDDDNQDLNVDSDDTATYGQPQYTEADIISCSSNEPLDKDERKQFENVIASEEQRIIPEDNELTQENSKGTGLTNGETKPENPTVTMTQLQTISSLKSKIKKLEESIHHDEQMKCLICMESYRQPVVSVCCWHVHCEECWLRTLGTRKLCPQCYMITSPNDLRKIYI